MNDESVSNKISFIAWRFHLVLIFIICIVIGLTLRVFDLAIFDRQFLITQGDDRVLRLVAKPAFRGMIMDRNGSPLAVSTTVYSVWANPNEFNSHDGNVNNFSHLLATKKTNIIAVINKYKQKNKAFVYIKRGISPELASKIKALELPGIYLQEEYKRYYTDGEIAAHIIGFTNIDDNGQEGIELAYNDWLSGEAGKKWVIKDRIGRIISDVRTIKEQKPGQDITLSIDKRIQYIAYKELLNGVLQNRAVAGTAIVLDVKTGEVLAMVNYPSYNPNIRPAHLNDRIRNRAVTDTFEPGSTIKAFSIASALDSRHFKPDMLIDTAPGWMRVGHNVVRDERNYGTISVMRVLQVSSNMGVTKMILALPPDHLWGLLHRVGFGEITGIGFPGEQNGSLVQHQPWGAFTLATLSFGYGLSVTTLQLARAYAVIANYGMKLPVSLLKLDEPPSGKRVMDEEIAKQMLALLESVIKSGTGKIANVPGYRIAGKTGTSKIAKHGIYEKHRYIASFVGIAPLSNPRLVVAVVVNDPQGKDYHGGPVSGPIFEKIMESSLRILNVEPDAEIA